MSQLPQLLLCVCETVKDEALSLRDSTRHLQHAAEPLKDDDSMETDVPRGPHKDHKDGVSPLHPSIHSSGQAGVVSPPKVVFFGGGLKGVRAGAAPGQGAVPHRRGRRALGGRDAEGSGAAVSAHRHGTQSALQTEPLLHRGRLAPAAYTGAHAAGQLS